MRKESEMQPFTFCVGVAPWCSMSCLLPFSSSACFTNTGKGLEFQASSQRVYAYSDYERVKSHSFWALRSAIGTSRHFSTRRSLFLFVEFQFSLSLSYHHHHHHHHFILSKKMSSIRLCSALLRRPTVLRSPFASRIQAGRPIVQPFSSTSRLRATSASPTSSIKNPAEEESQRNLEIGTAALEAGNVKDAKLSYERAISIFETPSAHFNLGVCHYHEKDIDSAIQSWKSTLRLSPDSADAHTNLASAYVMSVPSRPDLAIEHLKQAAAITPEDAEVQFNLGAVLEACEQLDESIKAYERAHKGGIERAKENIRNVNAKILAIKTAPRPEGLEEAAKIVEQRREAAAKEEAKKDEHTGKNT